MQSCSLRSLAAGFLSKVQNGPYCPLLERAGAIIKDAHAYARIQIEKPFFCGSRCIRLVSLLNAAPPLLFGFSSLDPEMKNNRNHKAKNSLHRIISVMPYPAPVPGDRLFHSKKKHREPVPIPGEDKT